MSAPFRARVRIRNTIAIRFPETLGAVLQIGYEHIAALGGFAREGMRDVSANLNAFWENQKLFTIMPTTR